MMSLPSSYAGTRLRVLGLQRLKSSARLVQVKRRGAPKSCDKGVE